MPVVIVGVEAGAVTTDGSGSQLFASLDEALATFPGLDVRRNTPPFTRANFLLAAANGRGTRLFRD